MRGCEPITIQRTAEGVSINAQIFDPRSGKLVATMTGNALHAITGENLSVDRGGDLSTLAVRDRGKNELLYIRYHNPNAIRIRAVFFCPRWGFAVISNEGTTLRDIRGAITANIHGICSINGGIEFSMTLGAPCRGSKIHNSPK
jgi:hypothetical protein